MWPFGIVKHDVDLHDVVEVLQTDADEMIQAFPPQRFDPTFSERIRKGRLERSFDHTTKSIEPAIERLGKLLVSIVDQVSQFHAFVLQPHRDVSRLLKHPLFGRMVCAWGNEHFSRAEMNEHQTECLPFAEGRPDVLAEEITGDHYIDVGLNEQIPRRYLSSHRVTIWIRQNPLVNQHATLRTETWSQGELFQFADNAADSPANIFPRQTNDEVSDRFSDSRSPHPARFTAFFLLPNPATIRLDMHDADDIMHVMIELLTENDQSRPILWRENHSVAGQLGPQQLNLQFEKSKFPSRRADQASLSIRMNVMSHC